jgi:hypothetical protein
MRKKPAGVLDVSMRTLPFETKTLPALPVAAPVGSRLTISAENSCAGGV